MSDPTPVLAAHPGLRDRWYAVASAAAVAADPVGVEVLGCRLVVWRDGGGRLAAAPDRCPHREAPLSLGRVESGRLVCAYHGWTFDSAGRCVGVPSSGADAAVPPTAHLQPFPAVERYGLVWVSPGNPAGEPPVIVQDADPSFRRLNVEVERWSVSATRMTDNFCDVAHFPYVHATTLGADVDPVVEPFHVEELDGGFVGYRYSVDVDNATGERVTQEMTTGFHLPFLVRSTTRIASGADAGSERVLLLCTTPVDDETSLFTFVVWRNSEAGPTDDEQLAFDRAVGAEDRALLERIPGVLPLDVGATVNVRSDRHSIEWRRHLAALLTP